MNKVFAYILSLVLVACTMLQFSNEDVVKATSISPQLIMAFPALTVPGGGCAGANNHTIATMNFCSDQYYGNPNVTGWLEQVSAAAVDTGLGSQTTGCITGGVGCGPSFSFTSTDIKYKSITPGFSVTGISNTTGTTTATVSGGAWEAGNYICIQGSSSSVYNSCNWLLTAVTYTGSNNTTVSWAQGGSPATCSSGCGNILSSCGALIPNHSAAPCKVELVIQHMTTGPNQGVPIYVTSQAWADYAAQHTPWIPLSTYPIDYDIYVGTHYYHQTAIIASGNVGFCTAGSGTPSWNTSGSTNTDGTCVWQDDGSSTSTGHAYPQDAATSGFAGSYAGCNNVPVGCFVPNSSTVFNINNTNCGSGGVSACTPAEVASGELTPWETPYQYWLNLFNGCYDGDVYPCNSTHTGNPGAVWHYVNWPADYMRIGYIVGGESFPFLSSTIQSKYGLTGLEFISIWAWGGGQSYTGNYAAWKAASPSWYPLAAVNECNSGCGSNFINLPLALAGYAMAYPGYSLGSQGAQSSDLTNAVTSGFPCANTTPTSNAFTCLKMTYWTASPVLEEQTDGSSSSVNNGSSCTTIENNTGILPFVLVFATQHHTNSLEIYSEDIIAAFDPNYVPVPVSGQNGYCLTYAQAQAEGLPAALNNAALGLPSSTVIFTGNTLRLGSSLQN